MKKTPATKQRIKRLSRWVKNRARGRGAREISRKTREAKNGPNQ